MPRVRATPWVAAKPVTLWSLPTNIGYCLVREGLPVERLREPVPAGGIAELVAQTPRRLAAWARRPALTRDRRHIWQKTGMEKLTGLTSAALGVYIVVSEGSRVVFPPRNLIPVP